MTHESHRHLARVVVLALFCLFSSSCVGASRFDEPIRAVHLPLRNITVADAERVASASKDAGFNTLIIALADGVDFPTYPGMALESAWTVAELKEFIRYCDGLGVRVVPEVKLLTHQEKFFGTQHPTLMFNADNYDPRNPKVYSKVFAYLDDVIDVVHPEAIHIGHDEVVGREQKKWYRRIFASTLPADLFLADVLKLHAYLSKRNVETWMWGDMLISPEEFPGMLEQHLHGGIAGYGKALRAKIPRDVVIIDWHYSDSQQDFPSLKAFSDEGFRVLGATWYKRSTISNFSAYAARHGAAGMVATVWFYPQKGEWGLVSSTISESGKVFRGDFPDER